MTLLAATAAASIAPAAAQGSAASGAAIVLPHTGSECSEVPQCLAVGGERLVVLPERVATVAVGCPDTHPYGWHWDTEQHAHLHTRLAARTPGALTFVVENQGDRAGEVRILLGCSAQRYDAAAAGSQTSRRGALPRIPGIAKEGTP
ncbi:MAG: hypothetical protein U1F54_08190 [Burkholderiales bacterium]